MITDFDPKRAILQEIEGLLMVKKDIQTLVRKAEQEIGQAEIVLNAAKKTEGFLEIELERKRAVLREIQEQENK